MRSNSVACGWVMGNSEVASADKNKKSHEGKPKSHEQLQFLIRILVDTSARYKVTRSFLTIPRPSSRQFCKRGFYRLILATRSTSVLAGHPAGTGKNSGRAN